VSYEYFNRSKTARFNGGEMSIAEDYVTISQAARALSVTRQTIHRWIKQGLLSCERVGREALIDRAAVEGFRDTCFCPYCHRYNPRLEEK
jgi:excisionase family DNA binding protein